MLWLDEYERRARCAPGLLALLPIAVVAVVTGLRSNVVVSGISGVVIAGGGSLVLVGVVRQRGRDIEARLLPTFGGWPTTALLRTAGASLSDPLRDSRRKHVARVAKFRLPTSAAEAKDPAEADRLIEAAVAILRARTRDQAKFPLVFAENRNYGFERNMLGMRPIGVSIATVATLTIAGLIPTTDLGLPAIATGVATTLVTLLIWWRYPTDLRVKAAGERYAVALLDAAAAVDN